MTSDLQTLRASLADQDPEADDFDLKVDQLVMNIDPLLGDTICQPIFEFFEAHPVSYAGAPGAFVHQIETFLSILRPCVDPVCSSATITEHNFDDEPHSELS